MLLSLAGQATAEILPRRGAGQATAETLTAHGHGMECGASHRGFKVGWVVDEWAAGRAGEGGPHVDANCGSRVSESVRAPAGAGHTASLATIKMKAFIVMAALNSIKAFNTCNKNASTMHGHIIITTKPTHNDKR